MRLIKYVALNHCSPCSGGTHDGAVGKDFHNFWSKVFPVGMTSYAKGSNKILLLEIIVVG